MEYVYDSFGVPHTTFKGSNFHLVGGVFGFCVGVVLGAKRLRCKTIDKMVLEALCIS